MENIHEIWMLSNTDIDLVEEEVMIQFIQLMNNKGYEYEC